VNTSASQATNVAAEDSPLRVAMISNYLPSGSKIGVGYQAHALANALVDRGHEVRLFSSCSASAGARYSTTTLALDGANRTFKFALALRQVDWRAFDVLHAHGDDYWLRGPSIPPHVRTFHGSCFSEARWSRGARERLRMMLLGASELLASAVADASVAVSENSRRWLPRVREVIPNGVDRSRVRLREPSERPSILFVGTYRNRKRGRLLMDVFSREVLPALPAAELWMVCEDAPERAGVKVLGRVTADRLAELYARAWLFCLPSTYEGFGIPYVEAMAAGCPVVATPNSGAREVTQEGRFGRLAVERSLGATLVELLGSASERERLSLAGAERASRYDLGDVTSAYLALYRDLIAARR
jgi:phosphatidyl-myo-inositol alpha-mannosyltransferase